ncbi:enoyl-CoA hydratase [Blastococcus sp. Marseille-P5729]|uniref:enoyl-CoA hydratase n=1 Tax=Blastococcus sp. Marseille-P5729 TaxID=2086582 RepID=UPI000D1052C7|nr:enoyl-CoA hydratase [Blastococcus sp. Marseille-P5729]
MGEQPVLLEVRDRVATITMNRPEARNALSRELLELLPRLMQQAEDDDAVDVLVLTGTDPAFTAGLDLKQVSEGVLIDTDSEAGVRKPFPELTKPLIGAVNGVAVTGGFELALCCDLLIASENARFADTHARVGVQPGWGLTVLLPQAIGVRRARELSLSGRFLDAATAYDWGLVNRVVPHAELMPTTYALAASIVDNDQAGVRRILRTYAENTAEQAAWENEAAAGWQWKHDQFSPEKVAERRAGIQARGRAQTSG